MKTVGIIAEYNPFHNGHKYQIDYARNVLHADFIIVAMSGDFTQRGSVAIFDKYTRANCALLNGADVIVEIPTLFATGSAKEYASAATILLAKTGVVDTLLFGAETDDIAKFTNAAKLMIQEETTDKFNNYIKDALSSGQLYASARASYFSNMFDQDLLSSPNNILGLEYCYSILKHNLALKPHCLKRSGNDYNSNELTGNLSSASAIRSELFKTQEVNEIASQIPSNTLSIISESTPVFDDDISSFLHYKLLSEKDFSKYLDCNKDISDRINKIKNNFISYSQFAELLKTKNLTYTRATRILCHIVLDITNSSFQSAKENGYINYMRMLGFSKNGANILASIKDHSTLPLITKPTEILSTHDIYSADIYQAIVTQKTGISYPNEYTRKFNLANI